MKNTYFWILVVAMTALMCVVDMALIPVLIDPVPTAEVRQNGALLHTLPLEEDNRVTVTTSNGGENSIVVFNNTICVAQANCPDQECVKQGLIKNAGEKITCAAHGLTIELINVDSDADKSVE